jgi:hypothetical protein
LKAIDESFSLFGDTNTSEMFALHVSLSSFHEQDLLCISFVRICHTKSLGSCRKERGGVARKTSEGEKRVVLKRRV